MCVCLVNFACVCACIWEEPLPLTMGSVSQGSATGASTSPSPLPHICLENCSVCALVGVWAMCVCCARVYAFVSCACVRVVRVLLRVWGSIEQLPLLRSRHHGERLTGIGNGREHFPVAAAAHLRGELLHMRPGRGMCVRVCFVSLSLLCVCVCVCACVLFESVCLCVVCACANGCFPGVFACVRCV